jgi:hypothetical protein
MINFDEEIKRFKPSKEISSVEDAIVKGDLTDMQDIVMELMKDAAVAKNTEEA